MQLQVSHLCPSDSLACLRSLWLGGCWFLFADISFVVVHGTAET
jgi:hypothetical protein